MTMHIYFKKDKDGYKNGWSGYVERSLARRFCENGIAVPYQQHEDELYDAEQAKKAELLKKKAEAPPVEKAEAKKPKQAEKSNLARKGANKAR
jgi:hypothetical protein